MITQILAFARKFLRNRRIEVPAYSTPVTPPAPLPPPVPIGPARRGRPASASLVRAVEYLASRPDVTAAELAPELGVSVSYARTLLRRARERHVEATPILVPAPTAAPAVHSESLDALASRLASTEREIQELRTRRASPRGRLDISCRAEVIRRSLAGETSAHIAASLGMPEGEVRFILKVQRILMQAS